MSQESVIVARVFYGRRMFLASIMGPGAHEWSAEKGNSLQLTRESADALIAREGWKEAQIVPVGEGGLPPRRAPQYWPTRWAFDGRSHARARGAS